MTHFIIDLIYRLNILLYIYKIQLFLMKFINTFMFLFIFQLIFSQEKLGWGQLSQDEINLTKVSFEPDADAVILREEADLFITKKGYILEEHSKIKILSTNGYENAQKKWRYYTGNNYDNITFEEGHTINIVNGKPIITPVNKSDLFITDINSNTKEISVAFPNVNVGSIIEYKIKTIRAFNGYSNVWNFQNNLPTLSSVLNKKNSSFGEIVLYGEYLNKKYKKKRTERNGS